MDVRRFTWVRPQGEWTHACWGSVSTSCLSKEQAEALQWSEPSETFASGSAIAASSPSVTGFSGGRMRK